MMTPLKFSLCSRVLVFNYHSQLLLVKHPKRGWEIPGGWVREKESIRLAAIREVKQKAGINIKLIKYCGVFQNLRSHKCELLFIGKPIGGRIAAGEEVEDAAYFPVDTAMRMISQRILKQQIMYCLHEKRHPFIVEY